MREKWWPALLVICTACGTASPPAPAPAASSSPAPPPAESGGKPAQFLPTTVYSGGDGSSLEQAVVVMADTEQAGVLRENEWIFARYGKFRKAGVGLATVEQRKFDAIRVELADHSEKEIFFDITSFFGKSDDK